MSPSSTLAVCDPPVITRLKGVAAALNTFVQRTGPARGDGIGKMSFLMTTVLEEITDELADSKSPQEIATYLTQIGSVIQWIGHGDNEKLPEHLRQFAEMIMPSVTPSLPTHSDEKGAPGITDGNEEKAS